MDASALFLFLVSTGMLFAALRARYRMGANYSVLRVRALGASQAVVAACAIAGGVMSIVQLGRTPAGFLYILAGINFLLAAGFFWYASDHRSTTGTGTVAR